MLLVLRVLRSQKCGALVIAQSTSCPKTRFAKMPSRNTLHVHRGIGRLFGPLLLRHLRCMRIRLLLLLPYDFLPSRAAPLDGHVAGLHCFN